MEEKQFSRHTTWYRDPGQCVSGSLSGLPEAGFCMFNKAMHCIAEQGRGDLCI